MYRLVINRPDEWGWVGSVSTAQDSGMGWISVLDIWGNFCAVQNFANNTFDHKMEVRFQCAILEGGSHSTLQDA